jgi:predicted secreted hydrolase
VILIRLFALAALFLAPDRLVAGEATGGWEQARPGYQFVFPRDHGPHYSFRTEWWYLTGNLRTSEGRQFGYELTFFRNGYLPPGERQGTTSRFVMSDIKFAHFTITDVQSNRFHFTDKTSRGAYQEAGFGAGDKLAWIDDWQLRLVQGHFEISARTKDFALELELVPERPPVLQGDHGFSRKAEGDNHASEYYSISRLHSAGTVQINQQTFSVAGSSWFDREWATNQLAPNQIGWDWFALQLQDGRDLMLYQMRLTDGSIDLCSNGTVIFADGHSTPLGRADFELTPLRYWTSPLDGANYPIAWTLKIKSLGVNCTIETPVPDQELRLAVRYWEGCVRCFDEQRKEIGVGYMELTGYAGSVSELGAK